MVNGTATVQQTMNVVGDGTAQAHDETYNLFLSKSATLEVSKFLILGFKYFNIYSCTYFLCYLQHGVDTVNSGMDNILYHSKDQTIKGSIVASPLTVDSFESSSTKLTEVGIMS